MPIFEEVKISWKGQEYVIPPDRIMQCIAKVEDVVTFAELYRAVDKGAVPLAKLSMAFAAVLRHAGARVTDAEVYAGMFASGEDSSGREALAITALLQMMIPPSMVKDAAAAKVPAGKAAAGETG